MISLSTKDLKTALRDALKFSDEVQVNTARITASDEWLIVCTTDKIAMARFRAKLNKPAEDPFDVFVRVGELRDATAALPATGKPQAFLDVAGDRLTIHLGGSALTLECVEPRFKNWLQVEDKLFAAPDGPLLRCPDGFTTEYLQRLPRRKEGRFHLFNVGGHVLLFDDDRKWSVALKPLRLRQAQAETLDNHLEDWKK